VAKLCSGVGRAARTMTSRDIRGHLPRVAAARLQVRYCRRMDAVSLLVNLDVDDLERGLAFYTGAFDLRIGRRFGREGVELLGGAAPIYLLLKPAGSAAHAAGGVRDYRRHWTPVHLDFVVTSLDAALARALAAGAVAESEVRSSAWGRMVQLADPFGHGLCLLEFSAAGYDAIAT
jgi:predicted enzyme related to lactoylglutathione lyase